MVRRWIIILVKDVRRRGEHSVPQTTTKHHFFGGTSTGWHWIRRATPDTRVYYDPHTIIMWSPKQQQTNNKKCPHLTTDDHHSSLITFIEAKVSVIGSKKKWNKTDSVVWLDTPVMSAGSQCEEWLDRRSVPWLSRCCLTDAVAHDSRTQGPSLAGCSLSQTSVSPKTRLWSHSHQILWTVLWISGCRWPVLALVAPGRAKHNIWFAIEIVSLSHPKSKQVLSLAHFFQPTSDQARDQQSVVHSLQVLFQTRTIGPETRVPLNHWDSQFDDTVVDFGRWCFALLLLTLDSQHVRQWFCRNSVARRDFVREWCALEPWNTHPKAKTVNRMMNITWNKNAE